jgi:hypothetical protein
LLLFYSVMDLHFIAWTMSETVVLCLDIDTPFLKMFFVFFW